MYIFSAGRMESMDEVECFDHFSFILVCKILFVYLFPVFSCFLNIVIIIIFIIFIIFFNVLCLNSNLNLFISVILLSLSSTLSPEHWIEESFIEKFIKKEKLQIIMMMKMEDKWMERNRPRKTNSKKYQ